MEKIIQEMKEEKNLTRKKLKNPKEKEEPFYSKLKKRIKILGLIIILISLGILTVFLVPYLLQFPLGWRP